MREGYPKQVRTVGAMSDVPKLQSLAQMLCTVPSMTGKPERYAVIKCKNPNCRQSLPRDEMVKFSADGHPFHLCPACAAARKPRGKKSDKGCR